MSSYILMIWTDWPNNILNWITSKGANYWENYIYRITSLSSEKFMSPENILVIYNCDLSKTDVHCKSLKEINCDFILASYNLCK